MRRIKPGRNARRKVKRKVERKVKLAQRQAQGQAILTIAALVLDESSAAEHVEYELSAEHLEALQEEKISLQTNNGGETKTKLSLDTQPHGNTEGIIIATKMCIPSFLKPKAAGVPPYAFGTTKRDHVAQHEKNRYSTTFL